ncbi:hypothetical protein C8F01DRAFT_28921 [Mycena amicta]|nr:hypothetical protein C8F01DRAFT_28921 [Mycena amicta]
MKALKADDLTAAKENIAESEEPTISSKRKRAGPTADGSDFEDEDKPKKKKASAKASSSKKAADPFKGVDLFLISFDGDADGSVEIYDSCDAIRRKIQKHLTKPGSGVTKAGFLRDIVRAAYPNSRDMNIQSKQLTDFLTKKGATAGSTSRVFYAAYVYFEKMRLSEGKPKDAHRRKMEDQWAFQGGLPRERPQKYFVPQGVVPVQNALGRVTTMRTGPPGFYL